MNIAELTPAFKSVWSWLYGLDVLQKIILGAGGVVTIGGGAKVVDSLYKWLLGKHDGKILHWLKEQLRSARLRNRREYIALAPLPLAAVAAAVKRSEKSVYKSLRRLESAGSVEEVADGWKLTGVPVPPPRPRVTVL